MKRRLLTALMLVACGQLAFADDQTKPQEPKAKPRANSGTAAANTPDAPRPVQTIVRRPVNPVVNPYFRPMNPNAAAAGNYRISPVNRNRLVIPDNSANAVNRGNRDNDSRTVVGGYNRPTVTRPDERGTARGNNFRNGTARLGPRTGNEISFAQARAQYSHSREHHDRDWWRHHHVRVVFYGGGYWFWNAGWWFPAWGYDPYYSNYVYDGPIYGYGQLPPGDVTAQVQEALAQQGYYYGAIDGVLGPETRDAILRFQADHGLATTAAIDEPTLDTLGLT